MAWDCRRAKHGQCMLVMLPPARPRPASPDRVESSMLTVVGLLACLAAQFPLALDT